MTDSERLAALLERHPHCGLPAPFLEEALGGWAALLLENLIARRIITALARYLETGDRGYWEGACSHLADLVEAEITQLAELTPPEVH